MPARRSIVGRHGDAWKVRVTAAPEHGRANDAVVRLVAEALAVPRDAVTIVSGHGARDKIVELTGVGPALIERRLVVRSGAGSWQKGQAFMSIDTPRLRAALLEERERIEHALESLRDDEAEEPAVSDNHLAETATATLDREIDVHARGELDADARQRSTPRSRASRRARYGTCETCGREISSERLEAYPWASLCIDCKREAERA